MSWQEWETVISAGADVVGLYRLKVSGGTLYTNELGGLCFVPEPRPAIEDLLHDAGAQGGDA